MNQLSLEKLMNYLVLTFFVITLLAAGIYGNTVLKNPKGTLSTEISYNMQFPHKFSDDSVGFYNGNSFIELNLKTQKTKNLSQFEMIPDVTQVFWTGKGVVFSTQELNTFSDLQSARDTIALNDPSSQAGIIPTYWYLSFETNTIDALSTNVMSPDLYGITATDGSFIYKDDFGTYSRILNNGEIEYGVANAGDNTRPVYADAKKLTYIEQTTATNGEANETTSIVMKRIEFENQKIEQLSDDVFDDSGSTIYSQITALSDTVFSVTKSIPKNKVGSDVYILDTAKKTRSKVTSNFEGTITKSGNDVSLVQKGRKFSTISKLTDNGISHSLLTEQSEYNITEALVLKDGFLINDRSGRAYVLSPSKQASKRYIAPFSGALEKSIKNLPQSISIERDIQSPYDTKYSISFNGSAREALSIVKTAISKKEYDPNQFTFVLSPGPQATY